jgi:hypothetical protein
MCWIHLGADLGCGFGRMCKCICDIENPADFNVPAQMEHFRIFKTN